MKKLLIVLLLGSALVYSAGHFAVNAISAKPQSVTIVDYNESYKQPVVDISFEDPLLLFCGSKLIQDGAFTEEQFITENRNGMDALLTDPLRIIKVIIVDGKAAGYVIYFRSMEPSVEAVINKLKEQKQLPENFTAEQEEEFAKQVLTANPSLKKTISEAKYISKIESIAVSTEFRRQGYAKQLISYAIADIKARWPYIETVVLDVNEHNEFARKLYESLGFKLSEIQPALFVMLHVVQYEKAI